MKIKLTNGNTVVLPVTGALIGHRIAEFQLVEADIQRMLLTPPGALYDLLRKWVIKFPPSDLQVLEPQAAAISAAPDCSHTWIANSGRGGMPIFRVNNQLGPARAMHVQCSGCDCRTWISEMEWARQ